MEKIDVIAVIDRSPMGILQWRVVILCGLIAMIDGFDIQTIAYVAPSITAQWSLAKGAFGSVFGVGTFGILIGNLCFSPLADRFGRKTISVAMVLIFGSMTFATAYAGTLDELLILRFLTGLGLGGIMPNMVALTNEYTPNRHRVTAVATMYTGVSLGSAFGGLLSSFLITTYGWPAVFLAGGGIALFMVMALLVGMPESLSFLASREQGDSRIAGLLGRIDTDTRYDTSDSFMILERKGRGVPVARLFQEGRTVQTLVLWCVFFSNLLCLQILFLWTPTLFRQAGMGIGNAVLFTAVLQFGAVFATIAFAWMIDRWSWPKVLIPSFSVLALCLIVAGFTGDNVPLLVAVLYLAVSCVQGSQACLNAVTSKLYPTSIRTTGVGWALGIGRVGSIVGPVVAGLILSIGWGGKGGVFLFMAPVALVTCAAIIVLSRLRSPDGTSQV